MSMHGRPALIVFSLAVAGAVLAGCAGASFAPKSAATAGQGSPGVDTHGAGVSAPPSRAAPSGEPSQVVTSSGRVGETIAPASPLVIRDGTVTLDVPKGHVLPTFDSVSSTAESLDGFVASSSGYGAADAGGASVVVRVPSNEFETLVRRIDKLGKVEAQSETGQDVTAASVNLSARIANLKAEETSLRTLLSRAGSIAAILQVQDQLFGVEGDIEQLSAQEGSLVDRATFATLTVELSPRVVPLPGPKRPHQNAFVRAVKLAAHNTAVAARAVVLAVGWAFPFLLLALGLFGAWWVRRRVIRRRPPAPSAPGVV